MTPKQQFQKERKINLKRLSSAKSLQKASEKILIKLLDYKYPYSFDWLGFPIIQWPQDVFAIQEIIWKVKPDLIIETGVAHGGGLIFYASLLELLGRGKVVGIEINLLPHNRRAIKRHPLSRRITLVDGSSVDPKVIKKVSRIALRHKKVMVVLDSFHTREHVLRELELYSKFVNKGSYIIVFDTIIEKFPRGYFSNRKDSSWRPWDKGNNPASAVKKFLKINKHFIPDKEIDCKILFTHAPGGFLKRVK